jgi:long-subunit fatty acid transport protein
MKKIFAVALVAMMALTANAQVYVGGSLGYNSSKESSEASSENTITFAPEIGYNLSDKWSIGLGINFASSERNDFTTTSMGVDVYGRYNYLTTGIATLFVEGGVGFTAYNHDGGNTFSIGVRPGISVALSEKLSLVAKTGVLGYSKNSDKAHGGSSFGISVDNSDLSLGLFYNF